MIKQLVLSENVFGVESFEGKEPSILGVREVGYLSHFLTKLNHLEGLLKCLEKFYISPLGFEANKALLCLWFYSKFECTWMC